MRKEIEREQSGALEYLENQVAGLKGQLERMEGLMLEMSRRPAPQDHQPPRPQPTIPHHAPFPSHTQLGPLIHPPLAPAHPLPPPTSTISNTTSQESYSLPRIPRPPTPLAKFEELLTSFLQPDHEPEFTSLLHWIKSGPPTRLDAIFPSNTEPGAEPVVSAPVVLSLAYRLSQVLAAKEGLLGEEGRTWCVWIRKCVGSMDGSVSFRFFFFFFPPVFCVCSLLI